MPSNGIISSPLTLNRVDYVTPEQGGRLIGVTAGWPLWQITIDLTTMTIDDADEWEAWMLSLRGVQRTFLATDPMRALPKFYRKGRPFQASPSAWSQAIAGNGDARLTLHGLDAGQVVSVNDLIGFRWSGASRRSLVRSLETAVADADGTVTVTIEPPVPAVTPAYATVNLQAPECIMRLVTDQTQLGALGLDGYVAAGGRIVGIQDLRP